GHRDDAVRQPVPPEACARAGACDRPPARRGCQHPAGAGGGAAPDPTPRRGPLTVAHAVSIRPGLRTVPAETASAAGHHAVPQPAASGRLSAAPAEATGLSSGAGSVLYVVSSTGSVRHGPDTDLLL